jgi:uncharacterized protein YecE (DUF72 family)
MIHLGTSGYSYADWVGPFYPEGTRSRDYLEYYARFFSAVEVDYTYYRMPSARTLAGMARKVGPGFKFAVKATSTITHERPATAATYAEFLRALEPLVAEDKLACILAQFPYSFHNTPENRAYLALLREGFGTASVVVEFRNAGWINDAVFALLRELNLGFCCVDQPRFSNLVPPVAVATADWAYVRFHGRNYAKWWQHEEAWQRYDYLYNREELAEWVPKVQALDAAAKHTAVLFNNHYSGQAIQNALEFEAMLEEVGVEVAQASPRN